MKVININRSKAVQGFKNEFTGLAPHYVGWAKNYVEQESPIPETWRDKFYDELVSEDAEYRKNLELALKVHGVRWI
jgi:hypothetical protein